MTVIPPRSPSDPTPVSGRTHRPSKLEPAQLGFTPQPPVAWLSPLQLAATGVRVAFAAQFGAYLDKRELQNAFPTKVHDEPSHGVPFGEAMSLIVLSPGRRP